MTEEFMHFTGNASPCTGKTIIPVLVSLDTAVPDFNSRFHPPAALLHMSNGRGNWECSPLMAVGRQKRIRVGLTYERLLDPLKRPKGLTIITHSHLWCYGGASAVHEHLFSLQGSVCGVRPYTYDRYDNERYIGRIEQKGPSLNIWQPCRAAGNDRHRILCSRHFGYSHYSYSKAVVCSIEKPV